MKFSMKVFVSSLVIVNAFMPAKVACAQTQAEESIMLLEPIKVTATRTERELLEVPMSVSVITAEEIKRSSATTIGELLQDIPGVTYTGTAGQIRVGIRGENAHRTLILIDGQKVSEQKSMSGSPMLVDPNNVERIEVIKGPASVLYGSDAIGGVINIITKRDTDKVITGGVGLGYLSSTNGFTQNANIAGSVKGLHYNLAVSNANHSDFQTPWGPITNSGFDQFDLRGSLSYDFNEKFTLGLDGSYFDSEIPTSVNNVVDEAYEPFGYVNLPQWEMKKVGFFAEAKDLSESFVRLRVDTWYQETFKDFANKFVFFSSGGVDYGQNGTAQNTLQTIGASFQTDWALGDNHYLIAGYEFTQEELDADDYNWSLFPGPGGPTEYTQQFEGAQTTFAGYLAMESSLPANFIASYGARFTYVKSEVTLSEKQILSGTSFPAAPLSSSSDAKHVFNVGLVWTGIEDLAFRANWAQGFRVPNLSNKYITGSKSSSISLANPDLEPETSNNFEIGARYMNGGLSTDIAGFYALADNYLNSILISSDNGVDVWQTKNVASATTFGAELALSYAFEKGLKPYTSATFLRRKFDNGIGEAPSDNTYDTFTPNLVGRVGLAYNTLFFKDKVGFNTDFYMRAETGADGYDDDGDLQHEAGFATLNFGIGTDFGKEKGWTIQAEVLNILDKEYRYNSYSGTLEAGINANLRLGYSF